jgi:hypothetical protein
MAHYHDPHGLSNPNAQNAATFNTIIDGQQAQTSPGMTTRVSKLWFNDTLQAEIFAVVNVVRGDHFVRPLITYTVRPTDCSRLTARQELDGTRRNTTALALQSLARRTASLNKSPLPFDQGDASVVLGGHFLRPCIAA